VVTTLFEAAAFHRSIKVQCYCGHTAILNPHALWWHFSRRGWDERIAKVRDRFICTRCPRKGWVTIVLTEDAETNDDLALPPDGEWKRAVNRFRN
jgi:hypothetical protein